MQTDIFLKDVRFSYEDVRYRTPIKFGGVALDRVTILNVEVDVETGRQVGARFRVDAARQRLGLSVRTMAYDANAGRHESGHRARRRVYR